MNSFDASKSLLTLLTLLALPHPAQADDAESDQTDIIVTGTRDGYASFDTTSGTKTATPILNVPQSISVVTEQELRDRALLTIADVIRTIPGASAGQGEGHRDQITLRGNNSTADFFVDGLRDDAQYLRSLYNVDRVEVHKGPNAMIFGRGGGGGVLNRVTKGAQAGQSFVGGGLSINSFGNWSGSFDGNLAIGQQAGLRFNAFYESIDGHRDFAEGHRLGINPVIGADLSGIRLQFGYEYVRDVRVIDRGIPSAFVGSIASPAPPAPGFRDTFFGVPNLNESEFEANTVRFRGEADVTSALKANVSLVYSNSDKVYTNAFPATAISNGTVGIESYREPTERQTFIAQANLEWTVQAGPLDHLILFGGEVTNQDTVTERIAGFFNPAILTAAGRRSIVTIRDPLIIPAIFFVAGPAGNTNRKVSSALSQSSIYLQDQISFGDKFDLIGGIRYDRLRIAVTNRFTGAIITRTDELWSPRAGLVFKPVPQASIYASYTKSYLPQSGDQFVTFDASFGALAPETFDNYEIGAKWNIRPALSFTIAAYRLDRGNTRAAGPAAGTTVLTGGQRTKGVEIGLTGKFSDAWQIALGYAFTSGQITTTTIAAPAGRRLAQVPRQQFSLWNRYDVSRRLGLGLGFYFQAASFANISNVTRLPGYMRIDAAAFWKVTSRIELQVNVENLFDARYFPVAHNDNNISTGAPINARFTLNFKI